MQKKSIIIFIFIVFLGLTLSFSLLFSKSKTFERDGVIFAITLDGKEQMNFPDYESGKYKVNINCNNATGRFRPILQDDNSYKMEFVLEDINGKVSCTLDFQTISSQDNLNNYLISILDNETFTTDDETIVDVGYRYHGTLPQNHIWFNDELWRIIGVFETELVSGETKTLTKIVKHDSIGRGSVSGNWPDSNMYKLLNNYYLNAEDGTESGYCSASNSSVTLNCDYRVKGIGIDSYYGKMLENVVWYLGGMSTSSSDENYYSTSTNNWYIYERSDIVNDGYNTTTTGYVGLLYGSDYGYSVPTYYTSGGICSRTTSYLTGYDLQKCAGYSWLYDLPESWLINTRSDSQYHYYIANNGAVATGTSMALKYIKPVVYLSEDVYVIDGIGTESDPYILGI